MIRNYWWKHLYLTCVLLFGMFFGGFSGAWLFKMPLTGVSTFDRFIWFSMFSLLFCFFLRWRTRLRFDPFVPLVSLVPTDSAYSLLAPTVKFGFCENFKKWKTVQNISTLVVVIHVYTYGLFDKCSHCLRHSRNNWFIVITFRYDPVWMKQNKKWGTCLSQRQFEYLNKILTELHHRNEWCRYFLWLQ